jgi:hypothetical protein
VIPDGATGLVLDAPEVAPRPRPPRAEWWAPLALFTAIAAMVCGPAILGFSAVGPEKQLDADSLYGALPEDVVRTYNDATPVVLDLPRDLAFAQGLHAGRIDVWNPHIGCGTPLWAEQGGPFFPLKLPFYILPSRATHNVFLALRLLFAGLGAFLLARRRGQALAAATFAGALFELSGALFAHLSFAAASAVFMLPWPLLGAQALADATGVRGRVRACVGTAIALGVTGHAGHPTLIAMAYACYGAAVVGHAVALLFRGRLRDAIATSLLAAFAACLGLAIAAPALLPLAELASVGRSYKDTSSGARIWMMDLERFRRTVPLAAFAPHLLRRFVTEMYTLFPYMFAPTLGVVGLSLAVAGVLAGGLGPSLALPLVLGVALGIAPPGFEWVHRAPVLRLIMPQYPWSLVALPLSISAGHALSRLASGRARLALVAGALLVAAGALSLKLITDYKQGDFYMRTMLDAALVIPRARFALAVPLAAAVALASLAAFLRAIPARARAFGLGAVAVVELAAILLPVTRQPFSLALRRSESEAVRFLRERQQAEGSRMHAIPYKLGHPNTTMAFGVDDVRQVSALPVRRYVEYLGTIGSIVGFTVQSVDRWRSPLFDLAAVRWVVVRRTDGAPEPLLGGDPGFPLRWRDQTVAIYENVGALPRFRVAHSMMPVKSREQAYYFMANFAAVRGFADKGDPVAVEPDEDGRPMKIFGVVAPSSGEGVRQITRPGAADDPDVLILDVQLDSEGMVVVADTFYPGWEATLDGKPVSIHAADLLFRAVRVPVGHHRIEMRYRPRSLRIGALACAVALIACALLLLGSRAERGR